jgi:hypothetical protein
MTWVFTHSTAAGADRLLLLAIADHAGDDGGDAWPSVPTLARKTGMSERTVQRGIGRLVDGGHLAVDRCAGRRGTNRYRVLMPPAGGATVSPGTPAAAAHDRCRTATGDGLTPVTQPCHPGGDVQVSPERPGTSFTPQPPASGGRPAEHRTAQSRPSRADGTSPRARHAAAERTAQLRRHEAAADQRAARQQAIAVCDRCDSRGYLPGGLVCDHDPHTPARAARGLALVRAALAERATAGQGVRA